MLQLQIKKGERECIKWNQKLEFFYYKAKAYLALAYTQLPTLAIFPRILN